MKIMNKKVAKVLDVVFFTVCAIIIAGCLLGFVSASKGTSMYPTFATEFGISLLNPLDTEYDRFDIVLKVDSDKVRTMKRIVGLPGETVSWCNGRVSINGVELDNPYTVEIPDKFDSRECPAYFKVLAEDEYVLMGDNLYQSKDDISKDTVTKKDEIKAVEIFTLHLGPSIKDKIPHKAP